MDKNMVRYAVTKELQNLDMVADVVQDALAHFRNMAERAAGPVEMQEDIEWYVEYIQRHLDAVLEIKLPTNNP